MRTLNAGFVLATLLVGGCVTDNDDAVLDAGAGACIPGQALECACPGGTAGTQECLDDLTFSACVCGEGDAGVARQCDAGDSEDKDCAANGTQSRLCGDDNRWGEWSACEAACDDGSQQIRPCGLNNRGEQDRDCADARWSPWTECADPDECTDGDTGEEACGLNGDGSRERTCAAGQWGEFGACADAAVCTNGAERSEACGRNGNGRRAQTCADGQWGAPGACDDPDACTDEQAEERACGLEAGGLQLRVCVGGAWSSWSPCDDPDARCEDGAVERVPCGLNRRGRQSHTCADERWGPWTECEDPDRCVDGATQRRACGREDSGLQGRTCEEGSWGTWTACEGEMVDPNHCEDGDVMREACGANGARSRTCRNDRWGNWTACMEQDGDCPVASVARLNIDAEPLETIRLAPGPDSLANGRGNPVAWRWVVVDRPEGSTAHLVEPPAGENGAGARDNVATPEADFFLDLAGSYRFELQVEGASGDIAPSETCPQAPARVDVQVTSHEAIHIQLVWDTPNDDDQTDGDGTDLDLHLIHPNGRWNTSPLDCYWQNISPDWGPVGEAGNPSLDIDDTNGAGPENINLDGPEDTRESAGYGVGVFYYRADNFLGAATWGDSRATVRIFLEGELAGEYEQVLERNEDFWDAARIRWSGRNRAAIAVDRPVVNGFPE